MRLVLQLVISALAVSTSAAAQTDPAKSPECLHALQALDTQEALVIAANQRKGAARNIAPIPDQGLEQSLEALRRQAARVCLGSRMDLPPPARQSARPPLSVAPAAPASAAGAGALPAPASAPPPVQIRPLTTITACDAVGCWTSDGTHLLRMGTMLVGPQGMCSVVGAVLSCQ